MEHTACVRISQFLCYKHHYFGGACCQAHTGTLSLCLPKRITLDMLNEERLWVLSPSDESLLTSGSAVLRRTQYFLSFMSRCCGPTSLQFSCLTICRNIARICFWWGWFLYICITFSHSANHRNLLLWSGLVVWVRWWQAPLLHLFLVTSYR